MSWIYRIATNSAIDHWRTRHRRAEVPLDELSEKQNNVPSLCRSKAALIERTVEHRERIAEVRRFLETLPQLHKRLVVLRYFAGLKLKEIAEKEGCKIGTVKSVLHRATHTLRLKLMRFYEQRQINFQDIPL